MSEWIAQIWTPAWQFWGQAAFGLFLFALLFALRGVLARLTTALVRRAASMLPSTAAEHLAQALQPPLRLLFPVLGLFLLLQSLPVPETAEAVAGRILLSLVIAGVFWFVYGIVDLLVDMADGMTRGRTSAEVHHWLCRSMRILVVLVAGATVLEAWGIAIAPILAGLGIGGVAVALGAQDLFKNLIGGAAILVERRFGIGDWIKADGVVEGTVERIGYRSTLVRQFDQAAAHVPNHQLSDAPVINYSAMQNRRIYWQVSLCYSASVSQLRQVRDEIEAYILSDPAFESPAKMSTFVRIDRFSDSSIDLLIYCFTKTVKWGEWLSIKEALLYRIKEIVEQAGTGFAFPSRSLYVESLPHGTPAAFAPPHRQLTGFDETAAGQSG